MNRNFDPNARDTALEVLLQVAKANAWSDGSLKRTIAKNQLDSRDAALATRLSYGVIQNKMLLDYYIDQWCSQRADHLEPVVLNILRLGGYQILFMDKIPHRAAVNEAVEMVKRWGRPKASGMVNAILRKFVVNWMDMPPLPQGTTAAFLSIRYSHPKWLVERLLDILGPEETEQYLQKNNDTVPTTIQINPLKTTAEKLEKELNERKTTIRDEISAQIAVARGFGDLSENAEYDEARKDQSRNETKIIELENMLRNCEVVDEDEVNTETIGVGNTIEVNNLTTKTKMTVTIVGANETNPKEMKISAESPIGAALLGRKKGEVVDVQVPMGTIQLKVMKITR